jgi:hypothetical protein
MVFRLNWSDLRVRRTSKQHRCKRPNSAISEVNVEGNGDDRPTRDPLTAWGRGTVIRTAVATSISAATWGAAPRLSNESDPSLLAKFDNLDGYRVLFSLPYGHALMNWNLATIKDVFPEHPDEPAVNKVRVQGVEADVDITGVVGTKSQRPTSIKGYGIPAVSLLLDIFAYKDFNNRDCSVLSTIVFPFSDGTEQSHAISPCGQPPDLTSSISGYIMDQLENGAIIAAANAAGQQYEKAPTVITLLRDDLFPLFDSAMRNTVGDEINKALAAFSPPLLEITTGDLMAPFLVFTVPAFDADKDTVEINFSAVGFSTMLKVMNTQNQQIEFATALSLLASGQGHLSRAGLDLKLTYKFNVGAGLKPVAPKYTAQINGSLIPKLEVAVNKLFPPQLDYMLLMLKLLPNRKNAPAARRN